MEHGVKESKELLVGLNELALLMVKHFKDGFQLSKDVPAIVMELLSNSELKEALSKAAEGVSQVPDEVKDMDANEVLELVMVQVQFVPQILESLKKESSSSEDRPE